MPLKALIKKGTRVLFYINHPDEIKESDREKLSTRLFIVYKFNINSGTPYIYLKHHLEARPENDCNKAELGTHFISQHYLAYLSLTANNFKALIEHHDFEVDPLGNIIFK